MLWVPKEVGEKGESCWFMYKGDSSVDLSPAYGV